MAATHSIDGLILAIKEYYNQNEFYDVHLNFLKKSIACPDSISHYLSRFGSHESLASHVEYYSTFNAVKFNSVVFYYNKNDDDAIVKKQYLGVFPSKELYTYLEDADFFVHADVFAICISLENDHEHFDPSEPEIYIFSTL